MKPVNKPRGTDFERCVLASGLLTRDELDEARAALRHSADGQGDAEACRAIRWGISMPHRWRDEQLADKLVEMGWLNRWQASQLLDGRTKFNLGPYWIVDSLGRGGMGQVFKGEHEVLRRVVAIKVLPRDKSTPEAVANFTQEIRAQAKLDHENLVRAFDAGQDGNVYYLVTEYVPGTTLRKLVRGRGPLTIEAAASIISQVAEGLKHAHQQGLIHRDVKPSNVLVTPDGRAKLSDLGLAGPLGGDADDPRFGKIVGTADYLSPDQIKSPWNPTPAWDIYSLGCTLYYAVTGKVPFPKGSTADKARAHCELQPLDPRRLNPKLAAAFVQVIADMLAKDPTERIPSADQVITRLATWTGAPTPIPMGDEGSGQPSEPDRPFSVTRPSVKKPRTTSGSKSAPSDEGNLEDTKSSFPEIPDTPAGSKESSSEASQTTDPVAFSGEDTSPAMGGMCGRHTPPSRVDIRPSEGTAERLADGRGSEKSLGILFPLLCLILLPVILVGAVMLIWWLFKLLQ